MSARSMGMHFGINGQSGGVVELLILAGAIGLVAVIVFTFIAQRAVGSNDGPPDVNHAHDEDDFPQ